MRPMRRKDRQIGLEQIKAIVEECHVLRVGLFDGTYPYIVPVNFGYEWQEDTLIAYIHGARQGKKLDCIKKYPQITIELDQKHQLIDGGLEAARYSYGYQSVMGFGIAEILSDPAEKRRALALLMRHETGKELAFFHQISEKQLLGTAVIKLTLTAISGKEHTLPQSK